LPSPALKVSLPAFPVSVSANCVPCRISLPVVPLIAIGAGAALSLSMMEAVAEAVPMVALTAPLKLKVKVSKCFGE
jgi:hypothetical protein